jgi:hypothetical protein
VQIEAFPSVLRLLNVGAYLDELLACSPSKLNTLKRFSYHRTLDNEEITITGDEMWIALNYQLMHLLDFLPEANWAVNLDDNLFNVFIRLHCLLTKAG